jgi:hypothetical protein
MPRAEFDVSGRGEDAAHGWSLNGRSWSVLRRADGVPTLEGTTDSPSVGLVLWLLGMSVLVAAIPVFAWWAGADWFTLLYTGTCTGVLCLMTLGTAVRVICVRRRLAQLRSARDIAESLGVDPESVRRLASAHAIRPAFVVNGEDRFDPASFHAVATLLRPAPPPAADTLLRPAGSTRFEPDSTLVRPSGPPGDDGHVL